MNHGSGTDDHDALLGAIAAGELAALERLYRELRVAVFAAALAVVGERELAEDVLQDTFLRVFEKAHSYRPVQPASLGGFFVTLSAPLVTHTRDFPR